MKVRPPTLRPKKRYVLSAVSPPWHSLEGRAVQAAVLEACTALWGDAVTARIQPAVILAEPSLVVVRCRRGTERQLSIALSTVTSDGNRPLAVRPLSTSGTLLSLKKKMPAWRKNVRQGVLEGEGETVAAAFYDEQKVDCIEKGIKGQNLVFLTAQDTGER